MRDQPNLFLIDEVVLDDIGLGNFLREAHNTVDWEVNLVSLVVCPFSQQMILRHLEPFDEDVASIQQHSLQVISWFF